MSKKNWFYAFLFLHLVFILMLLLSIIISGGRFPYQIIFILPTLATLFICIKIGPPE